MGNKEVIEFIGMPPVTALSEEEVELGAATDSSCTLKEAAAAAPAEGANKLTEVQRARAAKLAKELDAAFTWAYTPQGLRYWSKVCRQLHCLSEGRHDDPYPPSDTLPPGVVVPKDNTHNLSAGNHENLVVARDAIMNMCSWTLTPEGSDYWNDVYRRLSMMCVITAKLEE